MRIDEDTKRALELFEAALEELQRSCNAAIEALEPHPRMHRLRMQFAESGTDVESMSHVLINAQRGAVDVLLTGLDELQRAIAEGRAVDASLVLGSGETEVVRVSIKALFYFVRALIDRFYQALASIETGSAPARYGSMQAAASKAANPVAMALDEEAPGWLKWFRGFRDFRNEVKDSVNFAVTDNGPGVAVIFTTVSGRGLHIDTSGERTVTVEYLAEAVRQTAVLADVVTRRANNKH